jgi:hypothetical protein
VAGIDAGLINGHAPFHVLTSVLPSVAGIDCERPAVTARGRLFFCAPLSPNPQSPIPYLPGSIPPLDTRRDLC